MTITHGPDTGQLMFDEPHPIADRDRARIHLAFWQAAIQGAGRIDPNLVRARLVDSNGELEVHSRRLSGAYSSLQRREVIARDGEVTNLDRRGGNYGKPLNAYRVTSWPTLAALAGQELG